MKKQIPAILLGIACIALLAAYLGERKTNSVLRQQLAEQHADDAILAVAMADAEPASSPAPVVEPIAAEQAEAAEAAITESGGVEARNRRMLENIAKMMENPTMNKVMEASQRGTVAALYEDLIEYLNLNEEETRYFMDLLMYRHMKQVDMAMKMMSGNLSDEEKKALQEEISKASDTVQEEMEKFLNNEADFTEFKYYEKTMGERMMLSQMDKDLAGSGGELSDATYRELLGVMHDERENFEFTSDLSDQENTDLSPERFSRQNLANYANDIRNLNDTICQKARPILTPEQYDAFVDSLKTFTDMQIAQLEMAAQMFGGE